MGQNLLACKKKIGKYHHYALSKNSNRQSKHKFPSNGRPKGDSDNEHHWRPGTARASLFLNSLWDVSGPWFDWAFSRMNKYCKGRNRSGIDLHSLGHKFFLKAIYHCYRCSYSKWKLKTSLLFPKVTFIFWWNWIRKSLNKDDSYLYPGCFLSLSLKYHK